MDILVIIALVFIALATLKIPELPNFSYGWAGVFLLALIHSGLF